MIFCAAILQTQSPLKSEHGVQKPCKQVFSLILYRILIDIAPNLQYNLSIKLNTVGGACVWHRLVGRRRLAELRAGRGTRAFCKGAYKEVCYRNKSLSASYRRQSLTMRCEANTQAEIIPFESAT